jgi:hypothetical protein
VGVVRFGRARSIKADGDNCSGVFAAMIERVFLSVVAGLLIQTSAMAFDSSKLKQEGSLLLVDILPTLQQAPELIARIEALPGKAASEIGCWGRRFDPTWKHLVGWRVAPYSCQFGDRSLIISTRVTLLGKDGKAVADIRAKSEATAVSETITSWKWDPPDTSGLPLISCYLSLDLLWKRDGSACSN